MKSRHLSLTLAVATAGLFACTSGLDDPRYPTGSTSVLSSSDYGALYVANVDQGTVTVLNPTMMEKSEEIPVGEEPARLARTKHRVLVTLRNERAIAVLNEMDGSLVLERKIDTGAEPFGIVASEDGSRVYVALSMSDRIDELDGDTFEVLRSWDVGSEPKWLALRPDGDSLYVGSAMGGALSWIDLTEDNEVQTVGLPGVEATSFELEEGTPLATRITGDPSVSPAGDRLYVPALYVDNKSPVPEPDLSGDNFGPEPSGGCGYDGCGGDDGSGRGGGGRFTPTVVDVPLDEDGEPDVEAATPIDVTGFTVHDTAGPSVAVSSYPSSVTVAPNGETLAITFEASKAVGLVDSGLSTDFSLTNTLFEGDMFAKGFDSRDTVVVNTLDGPRGMAFTADDELFVHAFLDYSVQSVDIDEALDRLNARQSERVDRAFSEPQPHKAFRDVRVTDRALPTTVERGRRLFMSAADDRMSSPGAGVSCGTCHMDGRTDGLTWTFEGEALRQTPSLAGDISRTAPVTWTDGVASVQDEVEITSQGRMGGHGLDANDAQAVSAFVDYSREIDNPWKGSTDPRVLLGKEIFERADVGCAECHTGEAYTDNKAYSMYTLNAVRTRSLVGISATAPYLHDGSAVSLREVLERSRSAVMGDTSMLDESEMEALELYLKSL